MARIVRLMLVALLLVPGVVHASGEQCQRKAFGSYIQKDYKDTRARVLEARSTGDVTFRTSSGGKIYVERGSWTDPYTGRRYDDVEASLFEIDHVIPVCWAWYRGAADWTNAERRRFYNDPTYLAIVKKGLNRSKGSRGPDAFMPLDVNYACSYVTLFLDGVEEYSLVLPATEMHTLKQTRRLACDR